MFDTKKYLYVIILLVFLTSSLPFHLWAEEGSKKTTSDPKKAKGQQEQATAQDQPHISFDSRHYDVGDVWEGDEVVHTFTVKNTGTAQLDIHKVRPG